MAMPERGSLTVVMPFTNLRTALSMPPEIAENILAHPVSEIKEMAEKQWPRPDQGLLAKQAARERANFRLEGVNKRLTTISRSILNRNHPDAMAELVENTINNYFNHTINPPNTKKQLEIFKENIKKL